MKKLLLGLVFVVMTAVPAYAGGSELPPCEEGCVPTPPPPVCTNPPCNTADTGHDFNGEFLLFAGLVVVGSGSLVAARRRR